MGRTRDLRPDLGAVVETHGDLAGNTRAWTIMALMRPTAGLCKLWSQGAFFVLVLSCSGPDRSAPAIPTPTDDAPAVRLETARFPWAGLSLELPAGWEPLRAEPWVSFHPGDAVLDVRLWTREEGDPATLSGHVERIRDFQAMLADSVKESQYHTLRREEPFETAGGVTGWWTMYGYAATSPSRLAYYLVDREGRLVSIEVRLLSLRTERAWGWYDELIRQGLRPIEP